VKSVADWLIDKNWLDYIVTRINSALRPGAFELKTNQSEWNVARELWVSERLGKSIGGSRTKENGNSISRRKPLTSPMCHSDNYSVTVSALAAAESRWYLILDKRDTFTRIRILFNINSSDLIRSVYHTFCTFRPLYIVQFFNKICSFHKNVT